MAPDDNTKATDGNVNGFSLSKAIYFLGLVIGKEMILNKGTHISLILWV